MASELLVIWIADFMQASPAFGPLKRLAKLKGASKVNSTPYLSITPPDPILRPATHPIPELY